MLASDMNFAHVLTVAVSHFRTLSSVNGRLADHDRPWLTPAGGEGYSPKFWVGVCRVPHGSQNPDPISDRNM